MCFSLLEWLTVGNIENIFILLYIMLFVGGSHKSVWIRFQANNVALCTFYTDPINQLGSVFKQIMWPCVHFIQTNRVNARTSVRVYRTWTWTQRKFAKKRLALKVLNFSYNKYHPSNRAMTAQADDNERTPFSRLGVRFIIFQLITYTKMLNWKLLYEVFFKYW
jgi:hypothetical protein